MASVKDYTHLWICTLFPRCAGPLFFVAELDKYTVMDTVTVTVGYIEGIDYVLKTDSRSCPPWALIGGYFSL